MIPYVVKGSFYDSDTDVRWYKILCYDKFEEWCMQHDQSLWKQVPFQSGVLWVHEQLYRFILMRSV